MRLQDKELVRLALETYAKHLRVLDNDSLKEGLDRVDELKTKEIIEKDGGILILI